MSSTTIGALGGKNIKLKLKIYMLTSISEMWHKKSDSIHSSGCLKVEKGLFYFKHLKFHCLYVS